MAREDGKDWQSCNSSVERGKQVAGLLCFESIFTDRDIWREFPLSSLRMQNPGIGAALSFPLVSRSPSRTWIIEC